MQMPRSPTPETASPSHDCDRDEDLLERFRRDDDRTAFDRLMQRYEGELGRYLRRYVHDPQLAEDLLQATFIQVFRKARQFQAGKCVRPWLYSIATHLAIDSLRKTGRRSAVSLDAADETDDARLLEMLQTEVPSPETEAENLERARRVRRAVSELPQHLRTVVMLIFFQGLKYTEAAEALGIPAGTIKSRVHAALSRLKPACRNGDSG